MNHILDKLILLNVMNYWFQKDSTHTNDTRNEQRYLLQWFLGKVEILIIRQKNKEEVIDAAFGMYTIFKLYVNKC